MVIEKEKIMFHIKADLAEQIDDALFTLRKRVPRHQRKQLTKSAFYELIMMPLIDNFNEREEKSLLIMFVDNWARDLSK